VATWEQENNAMQNGTTKDINAEYYRQHRDAILEKKRVQRINAPPISPETRQKRLDWQASYREQNRELLRSRYRIFYQENRESRLQDSKLLHQKNSESIKAYQANYRDSHREQASQYHLNRRLNATPEQKEKRRQQNNKWSSNHPHRSRDWISKNKKRYAEWRSQYSAKNRDKANISNRIRYGRLSKVKTDPNAYKFYEFVRSKKSIPCYYCGKRISGKEAHIDHVIALAKDGNHASENLCASCPKCNWRKNAKLPSELHFLDQPLLNL
jgi:5-methylcytosine-specific restriction endonuclease McrA